MNVLSLFDGMSCCHLALDRVGINVDNYYASEIDKYAIQITQKNYPHTMQIGDITKWRDWNIEWKSIDLVTGGFPCQAWSVAGKQLGDKDERGKLFWTMLDIMKNVLYYNPNAKFLMENVKMKKEFEEYITYHTEQALGNVNKILINSALVSAQNRQRYYWTNIDGIVQPEDKGILIKDILDYSVTDSFPSNRVEKFEETMKSEIKQSINGIIQLNNPSFSQQRVYGIDGKSPTISAGNLGGGKEPCKIKLESSNIIIDAIYNNRPPRVYNDKSPTIRAGRYGLDVLLRPCFLIDAKNDSSQCKQVAIADDINGHDYLKRVYSQYGKMRTLDACTGGNREPKVLNETNINFMNKIYGKDTRWRKFKNNINGKSGCVVATLSKGLPRGVIITDETLQEKCYKNGVVDINDFKSNQATYRKLTPLECERLQTVPDGYTEGISNSQRYKMLGNGWTVDVIAHIFKGLK